jgi:hypothetical protein
MVENVADISTLRLKMILSIYFLSLCLSALVTWCFVVKIAFLKYSHKGTKALRIVCMPAAYWDKVQSKLLENQVV